MLLKKIKNKKIKVLIVGCGYTGYPLAKIISASKINVVGYDINKNLINNLKKITYRNKNNFLKFDNFWIKKKDLRKINYKKKDIFENIKKFRGIK